MHDPKKLAQNAKALKKDQTITDIVGDGKNWIGEPKLDGWRGLFHVTNEGVRVYSRAAKRYDGSLPAIEEQLSKLPHDTWLDGEMVVFGDAEQEWGSIQSIMGSSTERAASMSDIVTFVCFDILAFDGRDTRSLPFIRRREFLESVFEQVSFDDRVRLITQHEASAEFLAEALEAGNEGIILKNLDSPYSSGKRGYGQHKVKPQEDLDGVIMDYKEGKDSFAGLVGALIVGQYNADGELVPILRCSGMTMAVREDITRNREEWLGRVVEVKHHGKMGDGYRHPQFKRVREDKLATDCVLEEA